MTTVKLDGQISQYSAEAEEKVGDYLENVIATLPPDRIVTEVMLDGNRFAEDEGQSSISQALSHVKELQIRTADKAIWAATGLDIALSCVERVKPSLVRSAALFRDAHLAQANQFFAHCMEGMERFLEAITITRAAMNLDFSKIPTEHGNLMQTEESLLGILKGILVHQESKNYEELSDKIEYELLTNLSTWTSSLTQLRKTHNA